MTLSDDQVVALAKLEQEYGAANRLQGRDAADARRDANVTEAWSIVVAVGRDRVLGRCVVNRSGSVVWVGKKPAAA